MNTKNLIVFLLGLMYVESSISLHAMNQCQKNLISNSSTRSYTPSESSSLDHQPILNAGNLGILPLEILITIAEYLPRKYLLLLSATCKHVKNSLADISKPIILSGGNFESFRQNLKLIANQPSFHNRIIHMHAFFDATNENTSQLIQEICNQHLEKKIEELHIFNNHLTKLPVEIAQLTQLKILYLGEYPSLSQDDIRLICNNLLQLQELNFDYHKLTTFPIEIAQLKQLKKIKSIVPSQDAIRFAIKFIYNHLPQLQEIDLTYLELTALPNEIASLTQLKKIGLRGYPIAFHMFDRLSQDVIRSIGNHLPNIQELDLDNNNLTRLPIEIAQLIQLKKFILNNNRLPQNNIKLICNNLSQLQELDLSCNDLKELPTEIAQLTQLKKLNLSANYLKNLPAEIAQLIRLKELDLRYTYIHYLPKGIIPQSCFIRLRHI